MNVRKPKKFIMYLLLFAFYWCYIHYNQKPWRGKGISILHFHIKVHNWGKSDCNYNRKQKAGNEAWKNAGHRVTVHVLFNLLFYTPQGH